MQILWRDWHSLEFIFNKRRAGRHVRTTWQVERQAGAIWNYCNPACLKHKSTHCWSLILLNFFLHSTQLPLGTDYNVWETDPGSFLDSYHDMNRREFMSEHQHKTGWMR